MCGRYSVAPEPNAREIATIFELPVLSTIAGRYNVAPSQLAPVVRPGAEDERELVMLQWGLIPSWARDAKAGFSNINARAETVHEKPAFRDAFAKRRCLVVATGFYEWRTETAARDLFGEVTATTKQPYNIVSTGEPVFAMAGIWERWRDLETFCIITTSATPSLETIHDRMPVILPKDAWTRWLDPDAPADRLIQLLKPYEALRHYPVTKLVNSPRNDAPECVMPLAS